MTTSSPDAWDYYRDPELGVEAGHWHGASAPALRSHFHRETQLTFVLSGRRRFHVRGQEWHVDAGQCLVIGPGVLHRSLPLVHPGTRCINLYIPMPAVHHAAALFDPLGVTDLDWHAPIADIARRRGMSREAFTRSFSQRLGLPPNAYRIVDRLNQARQRLQAGAPIADLAIELGFADQSHLGRHFRQVFGVSPRIYRDGMRSSQTF